MKDQSNRKRDSEFGGGNKSNSSDSLKSSEQSKGNAGSGRANSRNKNRVDAAEQKPNPDNKPAEWREWKEQDLRALPAKSPEPIGTLQSEFRSRLEHLLGITQGESLFHSVQQNWQQFTGLLSDHTEPLEIKDDRLVVSVAESVYAQELQLHSRNILKSIEKTLGFRLKGLQIVRTGFRK